MRHFKMLCATAATVFSFSVARAADIYSEPAGSGGFGSASPPPAGTQEFVRDTFGATPPYYFDNGAQQGRTIATAGPVIDLSGNGGKQIQPLLRTNVTSSDGLRT